jgi:hypothetical protein
MASEDGLLYWLARLNNDELVEYIGDDHVDFLPKVVRASVFRQSCATASCSCRCCTTLMSCRDGLDVSPELHDGVGLSLELHDGVVLSLGLHDVDLLPEVRNGVGVWPEPHDDVVEASEQAFSSYGRSCATMLVKPPKASP